MNIRLPITTLLAVMLCTALVYGISAEASGPWEVLPHDGHSREEQPYLTQYSGDPLDLQGCQEDCRQSYGVFPYARGFGGGPGGTMGRLYALCIQECNDRYWKAWDEQMKHLGE